MYLDLDAKQIPVAIFMDLSKAFYTIDHNIRIRKLEHYGIENTELSWFKNYINGRQQYVEIKGMQSTMASINTGVTQGSILGPLLFLIYINDLYLASDSFTPIIMYADDTTRLSNLNTFSCTSSSISNVIHAELTKITYWLAVNKLSLNAAKTKMMIFHSRQKS